MGRNRYADLLRVSAMALVALGHWLLTSITYTGGRLSGVDALSYVSWGRWGTWLFQVVPVFFLVGGFANAVSWTAHRRRGEGWTEWVRGRALRLLWPTAVFVSAGLLGVALAGAAGADADEIGQAGWVVALQLWFLSVYLLLIALTPVLLAAHRRWGLAVPAVMAAGAAGVDAAVVGPRWHLIGFANYLLVWGTMHQWGFAWQDGTLTHPRWRPWALAAGGAAAMAALTALGPFPVDMIGAGQRTGNTTPPSVALLAFAAAQAGLVLAAEPAATRLLARPRLWRNVSRLNPAAMTVYLWHMVPAILIAVALYPAGIMPSPKAGSAGWWATRPAWVALLIAVGVPLTWAVMRAQRPLARLPAGLGNPGRWSPWLLSAGLAAAMAALARLAIGGFAPGGHPAVVPAAILAGGILAVLLSGHPPAGDSGTPSRPGHPARRSGVLAHPSRATPANIQPARSGAATAGHPGCHTRASATPGGTRARGPKNDPKSAAECL